MNLTEKIALDCGIKIAAPYIDRCFIPIKNDKFIIFDTRSRLEIGEYDYFIDVLDLIKDKLKENNIDIFQICNEKSYRLACDRCFISLNKKQEAYLISKAQLLITNENYTSYVASTFNTKRILLYSVFDSKNTAPVWNKQSQTILESHRYGNKPSYGSFKEKPKTINLISPYEIAKTILDNLNIKNNLEKYELLHLGENYNTKVLEIVPDFISNAGFLNNTNINLRLDLVDNLNFEVLKYWMQNKKVNLIINKNLNVNLLIPFKANIAMITVMLSDQISEAFLKNCKAIGIPVRTFCPDSYDLNTARLKFLDWTIEKEHRNIKNLNEIKNLNKKSKFVSSKALLSKGKQFSCKAAWIADKILDKNGETVILSKEFEEELEFFKIYNEREESIPSSSITQSLGIN
ncbi:MAG: hypothetical protein ACO25K_05975 [Candidatus Fonsibacter ubiquis]